MLTRLHGRVIEIDTGMLHSSYRGSGNALLIDGGIMSVVNQDGRQEIAVVNHPRNVGSRPGSVSAEVLQDILAVGEIKSIEERDTGLSDVTVAKDGITIDATFSPDPRKRKAVPELAAFRLDSFLELGMVPVTVSRTVDGKSGTMQFKPGSLANEAERSATGSGGGAWCPLPEQWNASTCLPT